MHLSQDVVAKLLKGARNKVKVGGKYTHYKSPDKFYEIVDIAILEATEEPVVLYRPLYLPPDERFIWVRTLNNFLEEVEVAGEMVSRFRSIE